MREVVRRRGRRGDRVACVAVLMAVAGLAMATPGLAARVTSRVTQDGREFIYLAAPGEINRVTVSSGQTCEGCEQDEVTFRGTPRPTGVGCEASATSLSCATDPDQQSGGVLVYLGDRNDTASGTAGILYGMTGNDRLTGAYVVGGLGNDILTGVAGADRLYGGSGNDQINSVDRGPADTVDCGTGIDTVRANRNDRLIGCERITRL